MKTNLRQRTRGVAALLLLGVATAAYAQSVGGGKITTRVVHEAVAMEYHTQEIQANMLGDTLTALGKEKWEIFQVLPIYKVENNNGESELVPQRYQILGRRPSSK